MPPKRRLRSCATTSMTSPSATSPRELRPAEGDAVEHVEAALEHELGVAAVGLARRASRSARGRRRAAPGCRCRTARAAGGRGGGRSRRRGPRMREVDGEARDRIRRRRRPRRGPGSAPGTPASAPSRSRTRRRRRARRGGSGGRRRRPARRRGGACRRSGTTPGSIGPRSAPTIAGRRRSSARRDATSPTMPDRPRTADDRRGGIVDRVRRGPRLGDRGLASGRAA